MKPLRWFLTPVVFLVFVVSFPPCAHELDSSINDPYLWLEDVNGKKALEWVKHQKKQAIETITSSTQFDKFHQKNLTMAQSNERIPYVTQRGDFLYNFWQNEQHIRGVYRRTTLEEYRKAKPKWETVIDFDLLAKAENEDWVFDSMVCHPEIPWMCLLCLSRGGSDAVVIREVNLSTKRFVENGFYLPEGKSLVEWLDKNTIYAATNIREGDSTESGYPAVIYTIKRGQALNQAEALFRTSLSTIGAWIVQEVDDKRRYNLIREDLTFFESNDFIITDKHFKKVVKPLSAEVKGIHKGLLFIQLKHDWQYNSHTYPSSAIIYASIDSVLSGAPEYQTLTHNSQNKILKSISFTQNTILLNWMVDVKSELESVFIDSLGKVDVTPIKLPKNGSITVEDSTYNSDDVYISYENFLTPTTLFLLNSQTFELTPLKKLPEFFSSENFVARQEFATSKDGTKVPYFVIHSKDTKLDGSNPTILHSYGGYEIALTPYYDPLMATNWLEQGGVYVIGNIRGGGEYGPKWHQAALKTNRHKAFEDFEAIAQDLIEQKITSPQHLGIIGGSNGGLLVGAVLTRRPELFKAVVSFVPLLDMLRFHKLLAGASWVAEYGNPENPEERAYLASYSPYHTIKKDILYPTTLIISSTKDDRVHPGHGRKMAAKMKEMGHDVFYVENTDGGHSVGANRRKTAYIVTLYYAFFHQQLK